MFSFRVWIEGTMKLEFQVCQEGWEVTQWVGCLPSRHEALGLITPKPKSRVLLCTSVILALKRLRELT